MDSSLVVKETENEVKPGEGSPSSNCPTCPPKPQFTECPHEKDSAEWKNWYEHFAHELVRWSYSLSLTVSRMNDECSSIKWGDLGLRDVEIIKETVLVTRIKDKPVVATEDEGVTLTVNCDIVTYSGTGVLINKGRGVVINVGSGIVINYSPGTCTNTKNGILICFGKCTLVNSGTGFGIIKTSKLLKSSDEPITLNPLGGMTIKDSSHLHKNHTIWDFNLNVDDSTDESLTHDDSNWSDIETSLSDFATDHSDHGSLYETDTSSSSCSKDYDESHHPTSTDTSNSGKETTNSADETDAEATSTLPTDEDSSIPSIPSYPSKKNHTSERSDFESDSRAHPEASNNESDAEPPKSISSDARTPSDGSLSSEPSANNPSTPESNKRNESSHFTAHYDINGNLLDNLDNTAPTVRE